MRPPVAEIPLTPEERTRAVARLLATGLVRLHDRDALSSGPPPAQPTEKLSEIPPELP